MAETIADPYTYDSTLRVLAWIEDGKDDPRVGEYFMPSEIPILIDIAQEKGTLGEMSREEAVITLSMWLGRWIGANEGMPDDLPGSPNPDN